MRAANDAILLCDGIFLLRPELRDRWDLRMVVTAAFDVRLRRALIRDAPRLGSVDVVEHRYRTRYEPGQELYRAERSPRPLPTSSSATTIPPLRCSGPHEPDPGARAVAARHGPWRLVQLATSAMTEASVARSDQ